MAGLLSVGVNVENLVEKLSIILESKNMMLCTAESCTGGMIAAAITDRAGSSGIFDRGFVTYSNASKSQLLGVDNLILESHGAVSKECAKAMALGALENSQANLAVSVTGIAGPDGGSIEKPVGLVFIGIATKSGHTQTFECLFIGNRKGIRKQTTHFAFEKLIDFITEENP